MSAAVPVGVDPISGAIVVAGRNVFPAGSLRVTDIGGGVLQIWSAAAVEFQDDWSRITTLAGAAFASSAAALAYLQGQFAQAPGGLLAEVEFIAPADGVQSIATTAARANLFWNGQRLASSAFTLSGGILQTSASLPVVAGDQLIIEPK